MKNTKFAYGTQSRKTLPFTLAGLTFFAKPLTVGEELTLSDIGDRYDLASLGSGERGLGAFVMDQSEALAGMLRSRVQGGAEDQVTTDWAAAHMGVVTLLRVLEFLRTGERPSESLELENWLDETITVQDREFSSRQISFAEQVHASSVPTEGTNREILGAGLTYLAELLGARALDEAPVTSEWLMENLAASDVADLTMLLQVGPQEDEDPNAEAEAEADNNSADESPTSAA